MALDVGWARRFIQAVAGLNLRCAAPAWRRLDTVLSIADSSVLQFTASSTVTLPAFALSPEGQSV
jgi:hypothetical protein